MCGCPPWESARAPPSVAAMAVGDLGGRRALVTGGGSGIGRAVAARLAEEGAAVVVADRDAAAAEAVAAAVGGTAVTVDLSDPAAVDALDADVDVLVNNAGFQHVAPLHEFPPEVFATILRLMVETPFRLVRAALPHMYARGWGRVVNISSVHGHRASPYKSAYVTAKHALEGLPKVVALAGAPPGATSHCVPPPYLRTPPVEGRVAARARTRGLSFTVAAQNLGLLTNYTGQDPEANGAGQANFQQFDFLTQPQVRRVNARLNVSF